MKTGDVIRNVDGQPIIAASDLPSVIGSAAPGQKVGKGKLGLGLRPLQPQQKRAAHVGGGLLVEEAAVPASLAGVQPGDVLMAINSLLHDSEGQAT